MDKKNNMKQAMYEMFGVGATPGDESTPAAASSPLSKPNAAAPQPLSQELDTPVLLQSEKKPAAARYEPQHKPAASYLAPGTVMVGTLHATGDVEIAGDFKGDITTQGTVILHANIQGNLSVSSLDLSGCNLLGDVVASGLVTISKGSCIRGNVTARELICAGQIDGDLKITDNTALESTAQINGNIRTGTVSIVKGAIIKGSMETQPPKAADKTSGK